MKKKKNNTLIIFLVILLVIGGLVWSVGSWVKETLVQQTLKEQAMWYNSLTVEQLKDTAITIPYDDLMRYPDTIGERVIFLDGRVHQIISKGTMLFHKKPEHWGEEAELYYVYYDEERILEDDKINLWGLTRGIKDWTSSKLTPEYSPKIKSLHIEITKKAGE